MNKISYFISRDLDGSVSHLVRTRETDRALCSEFFQDGRWIEDPSAIDYAFDSALGQQVSEDEALQIIAGLRRGAL